MSHGALKNPDMPNKVPATKPKQTHPEITEQERRELVEYFERRAAQLQVVETTKTAGGQILDWIETGSQHPHGKIASPPPPPNIPDTQSNGRRTRHARFELQEGGKLGPQGTVPILRTDPKKLPSNKNLDDLLLKHGRRTVTTVINGHAFEQPEVGGPHDYGATAQTVNCLGGEGTISLFDPYTAHSDEFSLSQIGLESSAGRLRQTVEAGWQEYRDILGDWIPHLFVFYTTNNYTKAGNNIGGYNHTVDGWTQFSQTLYPGAISNNVSTPGGDQWELFFKYQLYQGNWWLNVGGEWMGYYPASLFSDPGMRTGADAIKFFGEIVDSASHPDATKTQMGTGYFSGYEWPFAAYQRLLRYQKDANGAMADYNGTDIVTDTKEYDVDSHMNSGSDWGSYFWFGGPGAV